jgi:integrase
VEPQWNPKIKEASGMSLETGGKRFTSRWIETLRVRKRIDFTDPDVKGLTLRVTSTGSKSWSYLYRRKSDGRKRRVTLGEFPVMDLHKARAVASGHRAAVADGADPAADKSAHRKVETVNELLNRFLTDYAPSTSKWTAEVRRIFNKDIRPAIGSLKTSAVTKADVLAIINGVRDRGAGVTANRTLAAIRKAFNWAASEGYIVTSPATGIAPRVKEQSRSRSLTSDEIRTFWTGLDKAHMSEATKIALKIALATGQRIGEVCGARRSEVDFDKSEWVIPAKRVKNRREHSVPLSSMAVKLFRKAIKLAGDHDFIFPSKPRSKGVDRIQPLASHGVSHAMRRALKDLGLHNNPATPHDLRRTVATHLAAMGVGENIVARVLNHASEIGRTITGSVYIRHSFAKEKRRALDAWASELASITTQKSPKHNVVRLRGNRR